MSSIASTTFNYLRLSGALLHLAFPLDPLHNKYSQGATPGEEKGNQTIHPSISQAGQRRAYDRRAGTSHTHSQNLAPSALRGLAYLNIKPQPPASCRSKNLPVYHKLYAKHQTQEAESLMPHPHTEAPNTNKRRNKGVYAKRTEPGRVTSISELLQSTR